MEAVDGGWDDILHDSLHPLGDVLGTPDNIDGLRVCDIEYTSAFSWSSKNVDAPLPYRDGG